MAHSKGARRLTCAKIPPIYLLRVAQFTDVRVYDDRVIMAYIENTRGTWNVKGLSEHTEGRGTSRLWETGSRIFWELSLISLTARNHEFVSPWISIESIVSRRRPLTPRTYVCRRGVDFKFPWRSTARQHGSFVTEKEMRNVEKKGNGPRIVFLKESLVFKGGDAKAPR